MGLSGTYVCVCVCACVCVCVSVGLSGTCVCVRVCVCLCCARLFLTARARGFAVEPYLNLRYKGTDCAIMTPPSDPGMLTLDALATASASGFAGLFLDREEY